MPCMKANSACAARIINYARAIQKKRIDVYIMSYKDYARHKQLIEIEPGIYGYTGRCQKSSSTIRFLNNLKKISPKAILFYPSPNPRFEITFILWCKINRYNNIFCETNEVRKYEQSYYNTFSIVKKILYRIGAYIDDELMREFKGLICISTNIESYYFGYNENSIVVPTLSKIPYAQPDFCKNAKDNISFVFTGTLALEKENLNELLHGFYLFNSINKNWELSLYGTGPKLSVIELQKIIIDLHLRDKVHIKGEAPHCDIPNILYNADCLIMPRKNSMQNYYGFSTKLSEYAVSGTPIIMTDTGVVLDYFKDGVSCLKVNGYDAKAFCEQLLRFVRLSMSERQKIATGAFEVAKKNFNYENYSNLITSFMVGQ